MKFALVNGQRQEAKPGLSGKCPGCENPVIVKCGPSRIWHWAHKRKCVCDPRWESETEWHRNWKDRFPSDWQEVVHHADDGELHRADVKTGDGWVIEFQHSRIEPDERRSREAFYSKLVWVVDGLTRKKDKDQFLKAWKQGEQVGREHLRLRRTPPGNSALLREWAESPAPVFFDFGEDEPLGWLLPKKPGSSMYVMPFPRETFVGIHRCTATEIASSFDSLVEEFSELIALYESLLRSQAAYRFPPPPGRRRGYRRRGRL